MILGHANCRTAPTEQQRFAFFITAPLHEEIRTCFTLCVLVPSCSLKVFNDSHLNSFLTLNSKYSRIENYVLKGGLSNQIRAGSYRGRCAARFVHRLRYLHFTHCTFHSPGLRKAYCYTVVGIVTRLQLERPRNRSSIYDMNEIYPYPKAHNSSGAHLTSYLIGSGSYFRWGKEAGWVKQTTSV
jgi:hypothetical protein